MCISAHITIFLAVFRVKWKFGSNNFLKFLFCYKYNERLGGVVFTEKNQLRIIKSSRTLITIVILVVLKLRSLSTCGRCLNISFEIKGWNSTQNKNLKWQLLFDCTSDVLLSLKCFFCFHFNFGWPFKLVSY